MFFDNLDVAISESPVLETTDYYPFGLTFNSYTKPGTVDQNFKYNGKELVADLGFGLIDYQARWYDPALGRWHSVDPAADIMRRHSPYNYAFDNPIRFIDPDGMVNDDVVEKEKEVQQDTEQVEQNAGGGSPQKKPLKKMENVVRTKAFMKKMYKQLNDWANSDVAPQKFGEIHKDGTDGEESPSEMKSENTKVGNDDGDGMMTLLGKGVKKYGKQTVASILNAVNSVLKDNGVKVSNDNTPTNTADPTKPKITTKEIGRTDFFSVNGGQAGQIYHLEKTNNQTGEIYRKDSAVTNLSKILKGRPYNE